MIQIPDNCLSEIFENLDGLSLSSCILVCRIWRQISVTILWRSIWKIETFITCLPDESKDNLRRNEIPVPRGTPFFNYALFCKKFSFCDIQGRLEFFLNRRHSASSTISMDQKISVLSHEFLNLLMNNVSLNMLDLLHSKTNITNFASLFRVNNFLQNVKELYCESYYVSGFYSELFQVCHNVQSLDLILQHSITNTNDLANFLSGQRNLNYLEIWQFDVLEDQDIILRSIPNSIIELGLSVLGLVNLRSIIGNLNNLRVLKLSILNKYDYYGIETLDFPHLKVLKFLHADTAPTEEFIYMFLARHGNKLTEIRIDNISQSLRNNININWPNVIVK
ncbi:hypothetical protein RclHR1_12110006 [Rhizophagus clarus]|uniref:F-box domain-containing protein n=1 Tax=Rhizophagus clarus TaxID=94130 RepID=A0A2Z6QZ79_9GLOM|nr:hypothetical protein RclHR1_12110006 [Rhizophagus clarus]GES99105.1 hypothetical protein GLOIN_2v1876115 [Rhizophagus clarus]